MERHESGRGLCFGNHEGNESCGNMIHREAEHKRVEKMVEDAIDKKQKKPKKILKWKGQRDSVYESWKATTYRSVYQVIKIVHGRMKGSWTAKYLATDLAANAAWIDITVYPYPYDSKADAQAGCEEHHQRIEAALEAEAQPPGLIASRKKQVFFAMLRFETGCTEVVTARNVRDWIEEQFEGSDMMDKTAVISVYEEERKP